MRDQNNSEYRHFLRSVCNSWTHDWMKNVKNSKLHKIHGILFHSKIFMENMPHIWTCFLQGFIFRSSFPEYKISLHKKISSGFVTFTENILSRKFHFLYSVYVQRLHQMQNEMYKTCLDNLMTMFLESKTYSLSIDIYKLRYTNI